MVAADGGVVGVLIGWLARIGGLCCAFFVRSRLTGW